MTETELTLSLYRHHPLQSIYLDESISWSCRTTSKLHYLHWGITLIKVRETAASQISPTPHPRSGFFFFPFPGTLMLRGGEVGVRSRTECLFFSPPTPPSKPLNCIEILHNKVKHSINSSCTEIGAIPQLHSVPLAFKRSFLKVSLSWKLQKALSINFSDSSNPTQTNTT